MTGEPWSCLNCDIPMVDGRKYYCSPACLDAHAGRLRREELAEMAKVADAEKEAAA